MSEPRAREEPPSATPTAPDRARLGSIALRVAARYSDRTYRIYARSKLRWDPVFAAVGPLLAESPLPLLDIGCGIGLLGQYLRELGSGVRYLGLDLDARKIAAAERAAGGVDLAFASGDADRLPEFRGNVALIDVLHYLPADAQRRLLLDAGRRVAEGGMLVIRNVLRDPGWRFRLTVIEEAASHLLGWIRSPIGHYPSREEITAPLVEAGLRVHVESLWGRTPFNSYLIVARREPART